MVRRRQRYERICDSGHGEHDNYAERSHSALGKLSAGIYSIKNMNFPIAKSRVWDTVLMDSWSVSTVLFSPIVLWNKTQKKYVYIHNAPDICPGRAAGGKPQSRHAPARADTNFL